MSSWTSHLIGYVAMKSLYGALGRNLSVAGVCLAPDSIAIMKAALRPR
jgi:hypothetical protein